MPPRIIVAVRSALETRQDSRPFDPLSGDDEALAVALAPPEPSEGAARLEELSIERTANGLRRELGRLGKWWHVHGDTPVAVFSSEVNRAGGIGTGGRDSADVDRLRRALTFARAQIGSYCRENGLRRPQPRDNLG